MRHAGTNLAAQIPNLFAGLAYINLHTVQFTGGEVRGQITGRAPVRTIIPGPSKYTVQVIHDARHRRAALQAGVADRRNVPVVSAAASSEHGEPWHALPQVAIAASEIHRIAGIELLRIVELGVTHG